MRIGVVLMATIASLMASTAQAGNPRAALAIKQLGGAYRILDKPGAGEEAAFRNAMHGRAQDRADALFATLASLLGGQAPRLNFVGTDSPLISPSGDESANGGVTSGPLANAINVDPLAVGLILDDGRQAAHSAAINGLPHEMAHLRQVAQVLADVPAREGGAQAFSDYVTPTAAKRAGIPYTPGNYDGAYGDYTKQAQARGLAWLLAGQFGRAGTPQFP